jgi:hypothetical protein
MYLPAKTRPYLISGITSEMDLETTGGVGKGASRVWVTGAGLVWLVGFDGAGMHLPLAANNVEQALQSEWKEVAFGNPAVKLCTGGSYPAEPASSETIVLRLDEGTIKDSGDVTVTFAAGSYALADILAAINAAVAEALSLSSATVAEDVSDELQITSRAHGTAAAIEIVSIGSTLATATGLSVETVNGNATNAATGTVVIDW